MIRFLNGFNSPTSGTVQGPTWRPHLHTLSIPCLHRGIYSSRPRSATYSHSNPGLTTILIRLRLAPPVLTTRLEERWRRGRNQIISPLVGRPSAGIMMITPLVGGASAGRIRGWRTPPPPPYRENPCPNLARPLPTPCPRGGDPWRYFLRPPLRTPTLLNWALPRRERPPQSLEKFLTRRTETVIPPPVKPTRWGVISGPLVRPLPTPWGEG